MLTVGLMGAASSQALAQGVGNLGSLPLLIPQNAPNGWNIGGATGPVPVVRDPNGPPWLKILANPNGAAFPAIPGQTFTLNERLIVAGNLPWADWHEKIVTPFWDWSSTSITVNGAVPAGLNTTVTPGTAASGGAVDFVFNPIFPGALVDIQKTLTYNGPPGVIFLGTVEVQEFPTPEPASLGLLAIGGLLLRRRNRLAVH
jgi:hypothetical protein